MATDAANQELVRRTLPGGVGQIVLMLGDLVREEVDAIVNAANSGLLGGGGVDGAIHRAAGPELEEDCRRIHAAGGCPAGQAVLTRAGGRLKVRHVIHAVGPVWHGGNHGEAEVLASAYREALRLAREACDRMIAFPSLSTGAYGYPMKQAAGVALATVIEELRSPGIGARVEEVRFVLFHEDGAHVFRQILDQLLPPV